jgi:hypothetical protein
MWVVWVFRPFWLLFDRADLVGFGGSFYGLVLRANCKLSPLVDGNNDQATGVSLPACQSC